jgi:beta-xylosidase
MKKLLTIGALVCCSLNISAQTKAHNAASTGNPILPGYFADPTVKKFGDTYYIYATTDGSGAGFGPAQVWTSKDFSNWTLMPMNWPDTHWIWAPDVMQDKKDGKYYMVYCQPCQLHMGVSETPRGPWKNILGKSDAVLVPDRFVKNAITLDGQTFMDDDGSVYMYWGTWGIYEGFGCGAGKLNDDKKSFSETRLIPNTEVTDFFEAPFVLKRNGIYYFMYSSGSCHDHTYRVQYATSKKPLGPYKYQGCILETNADGTVHGPGHHSVLQEGDNYYIVYHRHDNPHSNRGFHRQLCIDKMEFLSDGTIKKITPTHNGIGQLAPSVICSKNLALGCKVEASSYYDDDFKPAYAVDDNNGTLWRPKGTDSEWLKIDLGKSQTIKTIMTQFEYGTQFYQYLIETSTDGQNWKVFADKSQNRLAGSPMVDFGNAKARYVRLTYLGGQKNGFGGAIWNIKVYPEIEDALPQQWLGLTPADWNGREWQNNEGMLGGSFKLKTGSVFRQHVDGKDVLVLQPGTELEFKSAVYCKTIKADKEPLTLTNLRHYNWEQAEAEKEYDDNNDIVRLPVADNQKKGLIVSITADDFHVGDTIPYIDNHGIGGYFETLTAPSVVETIKGHKAFRFDSLQVFQSSFTLPATMRDNAPYTLEAWVLNPKMALNECVADFTTTHDELEKIMLVNGTEPRCGVINHYGWYEDAGYKDIKQLEGEWQHIVVIFDGRIETVTINGKIISQKDIQLLIKPSQYITLGRNAEREWLFSGYLHSLKLWDDARIDK